MKMGKQKRSMTVRFVLLLTLTGALSPTYADFSLERVPFGNTPLPAGTVSADEGTVMFWTSRAAGEPLRFLDAGGTNVLTVSSGGMFPSFEVRMKDGPSLVYKRRTEGMGERDSLHMAFVWHKDGKCLVFLNGLPYENYFTAGERTHWDIRGNRLADAVALEFAKPKRPGWDRSYERFVVSARAFSNREVADAYRARMPFDFVTMDSVFAADMPARPAMTLAPGGAFTRPNPVEGLTNICGVADLTFTLLENKPDVPLKDQKTLAVKTFANFAVSRETDLSFDPIALPPGDYAVRLDVKLPSGTVYTRTRVYSAAERLDTSTAVASLDEWKKTELLYEKKFSVPSDMELTDGSLRSVRSPLGDYLECDPSAGKRMADVMRIPASAAVNEPLLLEIDWPDDKPRSMGFFMYPEGGSGVRDRLQMGIQSGREYPETFSKQTACYLIYASRTNLLFEARTMVNGWPAALSALRIYRLALPLPKLKLNLPEGMEGRLFGHVDEDQTFYNNLGGGSTGRIVGELVKYFGYTGENAFVYPMIRYYMGFEAAEGPLSGNGMFPARQGEFGYVLKTLKENGIMFTGKMSLNNVPDIARFDKIESDYRAKGLVQLDKDGLDRALYNVGDFQANPANPQCWKMCLDYFSDIYRRYGTNGLDAVAWDGFGVWNGLDFGYDDWTVRAFFRETGLQAPQGMLLDAKGQADYNARYAYLTLEGSEGREKWLDWRAGKTAGFFRYMLDTFRAANPKMEIYLCSSEQPKAFVEKGVDPQRLLAIPGIAGLIAVRDVTGFRWKLHRGMEEDDGFYRLYAGDGGELAKLRKAQGALPMLYTGGTYFETFTKTLDMKRFSCSFQDSDVKPWGRYWLKEFAYALAVSDALALVSGQQPLHTLGNETEAREFARAYRALPARPFETMAGGGDPITGRYLDSPNGTYFYFVNIHHTPVTAVLPKAVKANDLSTGVTSGFAKVALKPFELRSFRLVGGTSADVSAFSAELSEVSRRSYDKRLADLNRARKVFDENRLDHEGEDKIIAKAERFLAAGELNAAHQEFYRKELNLFLAKLEQIGDVIAEERLREKGVFRVNCGQMGYCKFEGDLFFPDKSWDGRTYGHVIFKNRSGQNSSPRDTKNMKRVKYAELFETEAFDIDEYRFNVGKPGTYKVTLYMKCGWELGFIPNWFKTYVTANGRPLFKDYLDMYEAQGHDFDRPIVSEHEVQVGADGMLMIELKCDPDYYLFNVRKPNTTLRLMNGITVERVEGSAGFTRKE